MRQLVPRFLLERVAAGEEHGSVEASAVYLDVAGFTPMTETLARHGEHGAEILAEILQAAWVPIVRAVHGESGFCAAFAGDALTAVFDGPWHPTRAIAAAHAVASALAPIRSQATPYGVFELTVRVGIGSGEVAWEVLRSRGGPRQSYMFTGSALARAIEAEHGARSGEVVVHPSARGEDAGRGSHAGAAPEPHDGAIARRFVSAELLDWHGPGEFRPVVTVFAGVEPDGVRELVGSVLELQDRFGGAMRPVEVGDKGPVLLTVWGAPVGFERDPERALQFAAELRRRHPSVRIGAGYGVAFTGFIGPGEHEEYAVYGTEVNLAARLMASAAPGEIVVSPALTARLGDRFSLRAIGRRLFKGIAEPVELHVLAGEIRAGARHALVGREVELAELDAFFAPLAEGRSAGAAVVVGDAGIGKSSLCEEASRRRGGGRWMIAAADPVWRGGLPPPPASPPSAPSPRRRSRRCRGSPSPSGSSASTPRW